MSTPEVADPDRLVNSQPGWNRRTQALVGASVDSLTGPSLALGQAAVIDARTFEDCYKEAKRRLLMCSMRIIDEQAVTQMKRDLLDGYWQIMASVAEAAAGPSTGVDSHVVVAGAGTKQLTLLGGNSFIVEYSDQQSLQKEGSIPRQAEEPDARKLEPAMAKQRGPTPGQASAEAESRAATSDLEAVLPPRGAPKPGFGATRLLATGPATVTGVQTLRADLSEKPQLSASAEESRSRTRSPREKDPDV